MKTVPLLEQYTSDPRTISLADALRNKETARIHLRGLSGSASALVGTAVFSMIKGIQVFVLPDKESAAYFSNDLENLLGESGEVFHKKLVLFYPTSYKRPYEIEKVDNTNVLLRTEVLKRLGVSAKPAIVVTYPEALTEKVVSQGYLKKHTLRLRKGEAVSIDFIYDLLEEYSFTRCDFVAEPGEFSLRGGIIDVFSFTNDYPYRIEFSGDEVESIRSFDPATQLSIDRLDHITILPNVQDRAHRESRETFLGYIPQTSTLWFSDALFTLDKLEQEYAKAEKAYELLGGEIEHLTPAELFTSRDVFARQMLGFPLVEIGGQSLFPQAMEIVYNTSPQPVFNKNFDLLLSNLADNADNQIANFILADNPKQVERLQLIFDDIRGNRGVSGDFNFTPVNLSLHEGFVDKDLSLACYTDHQIFERYHKFRLKESYNIKQALTIKEIYDLQPGDYVTHIDHGVGRFDGLEKIENNGRQQEAIRLLYHNQDILYVSIHSLHRITKYTGKEGTVPTLNRLGSNVWNKLKAKTKQRVKDIAKDLIKLYAERKSAHGFRFSPDTYLQNELEASFIYEDTPDQVKTTQDVKRDMEETFPMDRLVCGDVGFGKTEIAIRAAFKAVADSKQVAILVPTTILALQHYKTFRDRLSSFPCRVDYINRFRTAKEQHQTLKDLAEGKVDILIGTHRIVSKDVQFKDLGLMVIDEEQKFGVSTKEKLKLMKVNVDSLTLTATPIPRTLQFSLMGARDLSVINTPPPNRYPILTEIHPFGEEIIRDAISYEISRGGQAFMVNNRVQNIMEVSGLIQRLVPDARVAIGHGQMDGAKLEKIMLDFIDGRYDVLVATTIIESGLDIPNVNTIIINDAQNYGLSDLHQLRGRVGRSNRKAFCYLLAPPLATLPDEARKRLKAIEEFSDIGSGFNIAMRDLDIRGAGNILGAEQSGFISEIGFEMYHKILDEAIQELKLSDFSELYKDEPQGDFVRECQIETDMEILLPDLYINNTTERLSLYKELDNITTEEQLLKFQERLIDRFGPVPSETQELIHTIRLRWMAKELGIEKLVLKNRLLVGYFIHNQESPYYESAIFSRVLSYVQTNPKACRIKESNGKLTLTFPHVLTVLDALEVLRPLGEQTA